MGRSSGSTGAGGDVRAAGGSGAAGDGGRWGGTACPCGGVGVSESGTAGSRRGHVETRPGRATAGPPVSRYVGAAASVLRGRTGVGPGGVHGTAGEPSDDHAGRGGAQQECAGTAAGEGPDLLHEVAGLPPAQPVGQAVGPLGGLPRDLGHGPGLLAAVGHLPQLLAQRPDARRRPSAGRRRAWSPLPALSGTDGANMFAALVESLP